MYFSLLEIVSNAHENKSHEREFSWLYIIK